MKQRIISALIAILIMIPILFIGGLTYKVALILLAVLSLKELLDIKETKNEFPLPIKILSYGSLISLLTISDYKLLIGLFLIFLIPIIIYHNKKYNVEDAFFLISGILLLSIVFTLLIIFRVKDIYLLIYLVLISVTTDTFAYVGGRLFGKHKLIPSISPKKTWEGSISGSLICVIVGTIYYINVIGGNVYIVILMTLLLSILGQLGDLFFSAIKRYYNKKDFSNIMPGHGGLLDRLDSLIFIILGYTLFL